MHINTISLNSNHPKSVINHLNSTESLPFTEIFSVKSLTDIFQHINKRERIFTPDIIILGFLSQALNADKSCQAAVTRIIAFFLNQGKNAPSANTAAYSKARSRLPENTLSNLAKQSAKQMEEDIPPAWLWREKHIKLIDGSTVFMPDTPDNQIAYPQSRCQKSGLGFPIARILGILSYATGTILDIAVGACRGKGTGELSLLRQLMHVFNPGDVVIGDAAYTSFLLIALFKQLKVDIVFPFNHSRNCDFRRGQRLGKKDHLVQWRKPQRPEWMDQETYDTFPDEISIREVKVQSERKGFKPKSRIIVTTFMDSNNVTKKDLKILYEYRWHVELDLRSIKDTMHMGVLRGKSPSMVHKEIWAHVLAYNLIRKIMAQAACIHKKNPRDLSFKLALQSIDAFKQAGIFTVKRKDIYEYLLKMIACKKVGNRAGRCEPRRLKRRPKNFPLLMKSRGHYHGVAA
jgi:hypothetical protein